MAGRAIRKLVCQKLTPNFREAISMEAATLREPSSDEITVRNRVLGVNASDINFTAGRYNAQLRPPFDIGFEGLGEVVAVGAQVRHLRVGQLVCYMQYGAFGDYVNLKARTVFPVPAVDPAYLVLLVSGLTASISLSAIARLVAGETVLVTAAAGGTGHVAVQLAKLAGCHVIGTCSNETKSAFLRQIGCDRVINYKTDDLNTVLKRDYPRGVDVVYESVGGVTYEACLNNLAVGGRLLVIGWISGYQSERGFSASQVPVAQKLLPRSASVCGFFLFNHSKLFQSHFTELLQLLNAGRLKCQVDVGPQRFVGLQAVADAVDFLYNGQNVGKIAVFMDPMAKV